MERVPIRLGRLRTAVAASPALAPASAARVCRVCAEKAARYTCPRCNAPYCGVTCYRAHGEACTERFFEAQVRDELRLAGGDERRRTGAMLERVRTFHDSEQQAEDEDEELARRLRELVRLDERGELSLDALTDRERQRFLAEVADGRLGRFVGLWAPWWLLDERAYRRETSARRRSLTMDEVGSTEDHCSDEEASLESEAAAAGDVMIQPEHAFPAAIFTDREAKQVPRDWSALLPSGRSPSPTLRFHLVEVLFAYALVMRAFNGDYAQDVVDAASMLLDQSAVLRTDARYESLEHALLSCLERRAVDTSGGDRELVAVQDAMKLVGVPVFALDALRDEQAMISAYRLELEATDEPKESKAERKERRKVFKQLATVEKKIEFFIVWVVLADRDELEALAADLALALAMMNPSTGT